ncbi:MAG TPA: hypothetical protein VMF32_25350 [Xanthobacteraceae bacterium]|nr:hypothetical protein [Xanthobacteraceae bacterium]
MVWSCLDTKAARDRQSRAHPWGYPAPYPGLLGRSIYGAAGEIAAEMVSGAAERTDTERT